MTRLERATPWSQTKYTTNCTTSRRFFQLRSSVSQKHCKGTTYFGTCKRSIRFFCDFLIKKVISIHLDVLLCLQTSIKYKIRILNGEGIFASARQCPKYIKIYFQQKKTHAAEPIMTWHLYRNLRIWPCHKRERTIMFQTYLLSHVIRARKSILGYLAKYIRILGKVY